MKFTKVKKIMLFCCALWLPFANAQTVDIAYNNKAPQIKFAVSKLSGNLEKDFSNVKHRSLQSVKDNDNAQIRIGLARSKSIQRYLLQYNLTIQDIENEGYIILTSNDKNPDYLVISNDVNGLMTGTIQLAEYFSIDGYGTKINESKEPYIKNRGIQLNIPSEKGTNAFSKHKRKTVKNSDWDIDFWKKQIDYLAMCQYNIISFSNTCPLATMCEIPGMHDIMPDSITNFAQHDTKNFSMKKKIRFWNEVFDHAKNRGFQIYWCNEADFANSTKTNTLNNDVALKNYSDNAVFAFLDTYEQIDGFGINTNEAFENLPFDIREKWLRNVWGEPIDYYNSKHDNRNVQLIYNVLPSNTAFIMQEFNDMKNTPFALSYHYSVTKNNQTAPFHLTGNLTATTAKVNQLELKPWIQIANSDLFYFRLADPDYTRNYLLQLPYQSSEISGYFVGSDQYIIGQTFENPSKYKFYNKENNLNKNWLNFLLWGKLGYDPHVSEKHFIALTQQQYPEANAELLYDSWRLASQIFPSITSMLNNDTITEWYVEGCYADDGFIDINKLMNYMPESESPFYSIVEYIKVKKQNLPLTKATPLDASEKLIEIANETLEKANNIPHGQNVELDFLVADIKAMAYAGLYYAYKIDGAFWYHYGDFAKAETRLKTALFYMNNYVKTSAQQYPHKRFPVFYEEHNTPKSDNIYTWEAMLDGAKMDIELVRSKKP